MQALMKSGADVSAVDNAGNTPIHIACAMNGSWHGWDAEVEKQRPAWESPHDKLARARRLKLINPKQVQAAGRARTPLTVSVTRGRNCIRLCLCCRCC